MPKKIEERVIATMSGLEMVRKLTGEARDLGKNIEKFDDSRTGQALQKLAEAIELLAVEVEEMDRER